LGDFLALCRSGSMGSLKTLVYQRIPRPLTVVKFGCRGVIFAIEAGGHYWRNIAYYLDERGIPFRFINQYTLKWRHEGKDLNRRKNDYRGSKVAALVTNK
jgi:transposase